MKRTVLLLILSILLVQAAAAETVIVDPYASFPAEAALTDHLARALSEKLGTAFTARHEAETAEAVNVFLSLPDALLLTNPQALILSLQGYTDEDLRTAVQPVYRVAASGSAFFAAPAVAALLPDPTYDALVQYTEGHPYELFLARTIDASHNDYLGLEATQDLYVDQNLYMDYAEAAAEAQAGAPDLMVMSLAMLPEEVAQNYSLLFPSELPGIWQGVFAKTAGAADWTAKLSAPLGEITASPEWQTLLTAGGYEPASGADAQQFTQEFAQMTEDYIRYLTIEGLFFYEQ